MARTRLFLFVFLIFSFSLSIPAQAGVFDMFRIVVFSKMSGTVTLNGQPVAGAKITRTADHYHDKIYTQTTLSDDKGRYQFDEIVTWSFSVRDWFFDTVVSQEIHIEYEGKKYLGWQAFKNNRHAYGELAFRETDAKGKEIFCNFPLEKDDRKDHKIKISKTIDLNQVVTGLCEINQ
jgi:hypothetical protein